MRILLTTDTIGGVWTFTKELAIGLLNLGHSVALVSFGSAPSQEQLAWCSVVKARYDGCFRYRASTVPLEWMNPNENAYVDGESLLRDVIDEFGPDLLHSNQFCFGRLPVRIPRLITAHSDVLSWGAACRPNGLEPSQWLTQYCDLVKQGLAAADAVAAPTQWMLDALRHSFTLPAQGSVILNGRSLPMIDTDELRSLQAVSAGRLWDEAKNLEMLAHVHTAIPILIAGNPQYQAAMAAESIGTALQIGPLSEGELLALFRASSIYLATSIYEPFGLAPLEAALCGCAVLANDIPSLHEVWGDAALYFKDAITLTHLLAQLQASPESLLAARQRAGRHARHLCAARMTEEYLALYTTLLSSQKQSGTQTPAEDFAAYVS